MYIFLYIYIYISFDYCLGILTFNISLDQLQDAFITARLKFIVIIA